MCLVFVAHRVHPEFPLVVAANRDEFYKRPAQPAAWWDGQDILAGKDLEGGGAWLGVSRAGKFATVTNIRETYTRLRPTPSRGDLPVQFLSSEQPALAFGRELLPKAKAYNGFNLLVSDGKDLVYLHSQAMAAQQLSPGIYGISNALLDTPWPKLTDGKADFSMAVRKEKLVVEEFFELLSSTSVYPDDQLPDTGIPLEWERGLSARRIHINGYGTRVSTVVLFSKNEQVYFEERAVNPLGSVVQETFIPVKANIRS